MEFNDPPNVHGSAPWFVSRLPEADGPALWADYVSNGYLSGKFPLPALATFEWTHQVMRSDTDLMRLHRPLPRGCVVNLGSVSLRRNAFS